MRLIQLSAVAASLAIASIAFVGCDTKKASDTPTKESTSAATPWKTIDTPPGADPSVSAELGGNGFEEVAESLGFVTYVPKPEEQVLFGDPKAVTGGEIKFVATRYLISFRPFGFGQGTTFAENQYISGFCYERLLGTHPVTLDPVPGLATHWKISDDKKTFTFRINPNARFWNGAPVTAEDVVATYRLVMDPSILSPSMQMTYGKFEEPKAISKYIVEVTSKDLNWRNFIYFSGLTILWSGDIGKLTGKEFIEKYVYTMPVGSGEYIILNEDVQNQQSYAFTRRPDYWRNEDPMVKYNGNFDKVRFEVVKDNPTLEYEKFKKGEQDIFYFPGNMTDRWLRDTLVDPIQNGWIQKRRVQTDGPVGQNGYALNMRKWPFDDIRIRKAFAYLHNRNAILTKILENEYLPTYSYYTNTDYESPNVPKVAYNPEMAKKLLAEAGWTKKNDKGILIKDGKPFVLEFGIPKVLEIFITPYQQELRNVGIDLQLKIQDGNTIFKNMMERSFNITWVNWGGLVYPNPETSLSSKLADAAENNNVEGFKNARVDELLKVYDTTFSRAEQVKIIREIDQIVTESYKNVFAWHPNGSKIGYWNRFGMPEYYYGRHASVTDYVESAVSYWWFDAEKAKQLEDAMKNKTKLDNANKVIEINFWKQLKSAK